MSLVILTWSEGDYDVLLGVYSSKDRAEQAAVKYAELERAKGTNYVLEFRFYDVDLDESPPLEELPYESQYMRRGSTTLERVSPESWHLTVAISGDMVTTVSGEIIESQVKEEKIPAKCPVCGEPVAYAFYDKEGKLYVDPPNHCIVSEGGVPFHMEPGRDCWGKHTGHSNFKEPVEELVGVTTIKEYDQIEEIKGSCPKCGGPLEFREHIDAFNEDGSLSAEDTFRDPYCPSCKLLWLGQEAS